MINKYKIFFLILMVVSSVQSQAQLARADKKFNNYQYAEAIPLYQAVVEQDSSEIKAWIGLAECYRLTNRIDDAEKCYALVIGLPDCPPVYKYNYAQTLLTNGNYNRAKFWFNEYSLAEPTDKRPKDFIKTIVNRSVLVSDSDRYTLKKININSDDADFGAVPYKDGIIFSSSRDNKRANTKKDLWTGERFVSLYFAKGKEDQFSTPVLFAQSLQVKYNNGPVCFNNTGNELYFTRNNTDEIDDGNIKIDKLKIFSSVFDNGKFTKPKAFPYNNNEYSCAHPLISEDGNRLYFSSDMPGGYGGMDLWVCEKVTEGWGAPQNLGGAINTKGNEIFPTLNNDVLYFSSNGLGGLGGLDIFSTNLSGNSYSAPKNIGAPVNSNEDDFSFYFDDQTRSGYFSSKRNKQSNDDIYAFSSNEIILSGQVIDNLTNTPLALSKVKLMINDREFDNVKTDKEGKFKSYVLPNKDYAIIAENEKHENDTMLLHVDSRKPGDNEISVNLTLDNILLINDKFVMKNILYDYNKSKIRKDAAKELDRVVSVLKEHPNTKIELSSHTDCRANEEYNQKLSEKRAKAAVKYLVAHGISEDRLIAKGYGKTRLIKQCDCGNQGKKCSEAEHQINRRTEIKIIE